MEQFIHQFSELFAQLGLPSDGEGIHSFISEHAPLDAGIRLEDAPFWTSQQAHWLREEFLRDADWVEVIDQLNIALRGHVGVKH